MKVKDYELYELSFYAKEKTKLFDELKRIMWSIYEGLDAYNDVPEEHKEIFVINTQIDLLNCIEVLENEYSVLDSDNVFEISLE